MRAVRSLFVHNVLYRIKLIIIPSYPRVIRYSIFVPYCLELCNVISFLQHAFKRLQKPFSLNSLGWRFRNTSIVSLAIWIQIDRLVFEGGTSATRSSCQKCDCDTMCARVVGNQWVFMHINARLAKVEFVTMYDVTQAHTQTHAF